MQRKKRYGTRALAIVVLALFVYPVVPPTTQVQAEEAQLSLVDWLNARGQDSSFEGRRVLFMTHFPRELYRGRADQNLRLLQALQRGPRPRDESERGGTRRVPGRRGGPRGGPRQRPPGQRPPGQGRRVIVDQGWGLLLDTGGQVLRLNTPKQIDERRGRRAEPVRRSDLVVHATLPPQRGFVSAAMLAQKGKQFDDGLYAAVELAAQEGHGAFRGKRRLLETLAERLRQAGTSPAGVVVRGAHQLGRGWAPGSRFLRDASLTAALTTFWQDPKRSKPLGFYTWSPALERIFRQDRMLQTPLGQDTGVGLLARAIRHDEAARGTYAQMLALAEGLTNPFPYADLRARVERRGLAGGGKVYVLPPSRSHETELAKRMWGARPVPRGANLMDILVEQVREGALSLEPRPDSGWYDQQTWSLEPLLRPERTSEASRLVYTPEYRAHLEKLFRGVLALMRETHVKQLERPAVGAAAPDPSPEIHIHPGLTVEPLATHYARRADGYAFVRGILDGVFGQGALRGLKRLTAEGPVDVDLDTELAFMERLFRGAAAASRGEIGETREQDAAGSVDRAVFDAWRTLVGSDPDLARDARMMVPVFYDVQRRKTKVWVFLGWSERPLDISYAREPAILQEERVAPGPGEKPRVHFLHERWDIAYPVTAEVYVTQLLNRNQMRAHCDRFKSRTAILRNLR